MFSLDKRRLWGNLIVTFQYVKGPYRKDGEGLFIQACSDRTRSNGFKLKKERFRLHVRKEFFTQSAMRQWKSCPEKLGMPHPWRCSRPG